MDWMVMAAAVVVMAVVAISVTGRQRRTVRVQQEQLERLEAKLDIALGQQQSADPARPPLPVPNPTPDQQFWPDPRLDEVRHLAAQGKKIEAIKRYREITGARLLEAKNAVERISG